MKITYGLSREKMEIEAFGKGKLAYRQRVASARMKKKEQDIEIAQ